MLWYALTAQEKPVWHMPVEDLVILLSIRIDDTLTQAEHAAKHGMGKGTISGIIKRLGSEGDARRATGLGYVETRPHPTDARAQVPRLTASGRKALTALLNGLAPAPDRV